LRLMLHQLKDIVAPHPPHILLTFNPLLPIYGDLNTRQNFQRLLEDVCSWVELNPVAWDDVVLNRKQLLQACKAPTLVEIFRVVYEAAADSKNAKYWCCKSMDNVYFAQQLEKGGIEPYYIYLYRDGRDTALSFQKALVGEKHIYHLAQKWKTDQESAIDLCKTLPKERYIQVSYETLLHNAEQVIKDICTGLNIPFQASFNLYHHSIESKKTSGSGEMWQNVKKPILTDNYNKYKKQMSKSDLHLFESVASNALRSLGYSIEHQEDELRKSFSVDEIDSFTALNSSLKQLKRQNGQQKDLSKKKPQEAFLKEIVKRGHKNG